MMNESSVRVQPKRWKRSRGLRRQERLIEAKWLQYDAIHPSSSGQIDFGIFFLCAFTRKAGLANNVVSRDSSNSIYTPKLYSPDVTYPLPQTFV
ncbi:unnamed protein product [Protopolystoma xenopodis]|uniref:Uncharacterized protein n=1 Tax=Protopolystoma xenopodis TaxID=117903 RepID=A0A448X2M7_9PLAT|nr:unnamed protein product [Protopolystoma xenopodis]